MEDTRYEALNQAVLEILRNQRRIEERLDRLESAASGRTPESGTAEMITAIIATPASGEDSSANSQPPPQKDTQAIQVARVHPAMETKVGLTLVNRVGVITLILGVAFFFKWAADNNWIGPTGRVILGLLAGFAALAAAEFLWRKSQQVFAQGITGAGLAIVYLSAYAAWGFYHLIPSFLAFAFMASVTALAYALALRYASAAIAVLGFFGGYLTPFLLSNGEDHPWFLLSYVLLLDIAAMTLVKDKRWRSLEILAVTATTLIYFAWWASGASHKESAAGTLGALAYYTLFAYAGSAFSRVPSQILATLEIAFLWSDSAGPFFGLELYLAGAGLFQAVRRKQLPGLSVTFASFWLWTGVFLGNAGHLGTGAKFAGISAGFLFFLIFVVAAEYLLEFEMTSAPSLSLVAANGSVYFGLAYLLLRDRYHDWLGLLAVGVAISYLGLAILLRKRNALRDEVHARPLLLALGMAVAFVTLAIPIQLAGFHITIAWAIQAAALTWISAKVPSQRVTVAGACILGLVALRLLLFDSRLSWQETEAVQLILNGRFVTFVLSAACAFIAARWARALDLRLALGEYLAAHVALLSGLALETLLWAQKTSTPETVLSVETVSISILFAIYALALVSLGVATRTAINRIAGLALVSFVIVKLYLFDVWQLGRVYRIAAFVALGLLLISTSFLYSRFRPLIESLLRRDDTPS